MAGEFHGPNFTQDTSPFLAASRAISERGSPSDDITKAFQTGMGEMEQGQRIAKTDQQLKLDEALNPLKIENSRQVVRGQVLANDFADDTYDARVEHAKLVNAQQEAITKLTVTQGNVADYNFKKAQTDQSDELAVTQLLSEGEGLDTIDNAKELADLHFRALKAAKTQRGLDAVGAWWTQKKGTAQSKSDGLIDNAMTRDVQLGGFEPEDREKYLDLVNNKEVPPKQAYSMIKSQQVETQRKRDEDFKREAWGARYGGGKDQIAPSQIHPDDMAVVPKDFPKLMAGDDAAARHLNGLLAAAQSPEGANDPKLQKDIAIAAGQINERRRQIQGVTSGLTLKGNYDRGILPTDPKMLIEYYKAAYGDQPAGTPRGGKGGPMIKTTASQFGDARDENGIIHPDYTDVGTLPASQARTTADGTPFEHAPNKPIAALPQKEMERLGLKVGDKIVGRLGDGPEVVLTLGEVGPGKGRVKQGFGADLTQAAIKQMGGKGHEKGNFSGEFSYRPYQAGDGAIAGTKGKNTISLSQDSVGQKLASRVKGVKPGMKWEDPQNPGTIYTIVQ